MKKLIYQNDEGELTVLEGDNIRIAIGITDPGNPILEATGTVEFFDARVTLPDNYLLHIPGPNPSHLQSIVYWLAKLVLP